MEEAHRRLGTGEVRKAPVAERMAWFWIGSSNFFSEGVAESYIKSAYFNFERVMDL